MSKTIEPITSLEQELELRIEWLEKGLRTIQFEIAEKGVKFVDVRYLFNTAVSYLDGEPTTADEYNAKAKIELEKVNKGLNVLTSGMDALAKDNKKYVRISDINKEISKEWKKEDVIINLKDKTREDKIKKANMIQSIGYRGEE
mgnify:CR=1 FL=1